MFRAEPGSGWKGHAKAVLSLTFALLVVNGFIALVEWIW